MHIARPLLLRIALAVASAALPGTALAVTPAEVQKRLDEDGGLARIGDRVVELAPLKDFYRKRGWKLAWSGGGESAGDQMLMDIQAYAMAEGLSPESYAVPATNSDMEHDLLVSDALLRFGRDLATGRVGPSRSYGGLGPETRPGFDATAFLAKVAEGRPLSDLVDRLPPAYAGYQRLKTALEHHRQVARGGGWPAIPEGPSIKPGMEDERVPALRRRLVAGGELEEGQGKGKVLDDRLVAALKRFQHRHGLAADGAAGPQTIAALNVSAEDRVRQLQVNLERWRWMPRRLEPLHVAVNIPAQMLELVDHGEVKMKMRVVVGDLKHPTPGLQATMTSVVLNPTWTVPPSIASREILPKLKKDPNYLASNNMRILDAFPDDSPLAAGVGVDWASYDAGRFPFRLRQQPGPDNALGLVKFNLKDSDDIYLHDTPQRSAFSRPYRALSHGCVRLEKPVELAQAVLADVWDEKLDDIIAEKQTKTLKLERPVTVYLLYWTAWVEDDGSVHFRDDIYGHDARLRSALRRARQPAPAQVAVERAEG